VIAKIAHGLADDLLTCTALATRAPIIVAPAMNENMWANEITQENVAALRSRGVHVIDVGTGDLACGYQGRGRMADVGEIVGAVGRVLDESGS
jgi:phosphopantothenoylcysteine decarboxylase/phosphopantothenate--cysteine ligase